MMIAYDNAIIAARPLCWKMRRVQAVSSVIGHLTIYVPDQRCFGDRPWPADCFFRPVRQTYFADILIAGYGLFVGPIGWTYTFGVRVFALAWLSIKSDAAIIPRMTVDYRFFVVRQS